MLIKIGYKKLIRIKIEEIQNIISELYFGGT
jgi:hypothetical protein